MPSAAMRPAAFDALAPLLIRSSSSAFARSPAGFGQRLLAFHHAQPGALAQFHHHACGNFRHLVAPCSCWSCSPPRPRGALRASASGPAPPVAAADAGRRAGAPAAGAVRRRFVRDLDELVAGLDDLLDHRAAALEDRVGDAAGVQADRAARVVVARDHVRDADRRMVGVDDADDRDAELLRLGDRDLVVADVDDEQRVRQPVHVLDAAQALVELVAARAAASAPRACSSSRTCRPRCICSRSFRRLIDALTVLKLVSMPPSQRAST